MKHGFLLMIVAAMMGLGAHMAVSQTPADVRRTVRMSDTLVRSVLANVWTSTHPTLGYTPTEMEQYGPDAQLLRTVRLLYGDVTSIPRTGGTTAANLFSTTDMAAHARIGFGLTDVSAGRMLPLPADSLVSVPDEPRVLPMHVRRLIARIRDAATEATPWLEKAFSDDIFTQAFATAPSPDPEREQISINRAMALWTQDRLGQLACTDPYAVKMLQRTDRRSLAFGSVIFLAHLDRALREFTAADTASQTMPSGRWTVETPMGTIVVTGAGRDTVAEPVLAVIDLGGDDLYLGRVATAIGPVRPFNVVIDVAGNDTYVSVDDTAGIAAAFFGVSALADLRGDDRYHGRMCGMGAAWWGVAVLMDAQGDDEYVLDGTYGQGAATMGVGVLDDRAGNDRYICAAEAQAFAQTFGAGLLVERGGNDRYLARDDGAPSELYLGQSVSRAQGAAFGRRADLGDGHSLSGGVAVLADAEGDDVYHASAWSQGCGYWWAAGFLEDWSGNDTYRNGKYSLGAGAHFAIGCIVDVQGNDAYNVGNDEAVNQYHAHARDGSIGVAFDGAGDDAYHFRSHCGGSGDLGSIGLFWDRSGNDVYDVRYDLLGEAKGWANTPPMGTSTFYEPFHTYRDDLLTVGIFIDGSGTDGYRWSGTPDDLGVGRTANGSTKRIVRTPNARGLFIDR